MEALAEDQNACQMLDTDAFLHAILKIFERRPDQHTANEIAAFLAVTLGGLFRPSRKRVHPQKTPKIERGRGIRCRRIFARN